MSIKFCFAIGAGCQHSAKIDASAKPFAGGIMEQFKLKIVGNGTPRGTHITDQDGRRLSGVVSASWSEE